MRLDRLASFALAATLATLATPYAAAAQAPPMETLPQHQVMTTVRQFIDNFNKGNAQEMLAACSPSTNIVDEFGAHVWTSCAAWMHDLAADNKSTGITNPVVTLGLPWHVDVNGNRAYVVVPTSYNYLLKGRPAVETGSVFTLVLEKFSSGWKIIAWTWSAHTVS